MNSKLTGYLLGAIAAATYGTNPLFALPLYSHGMSAESVLFFRYLLAIPVIAVLLVARGQKFSIPAPRIIPVILMGILLAASSLMLFESYRYMDAGIASTLLFVYPLMVAVIMAVVFHEKIPVSTIVCIMTTMGGIGLLFKGGETPLSMSGTALVMISSLSYAIYMVGVDRPVMKSIPTLTMIFYVLITGAVQFGTKIYLSADSPDIPYGWEMWGCVVGLAVVPTAISFLCTTAAVQYIGPTPTAILGALEPVTAIIFGITVFGERLTVRDWIGIFLILLSVSVVIAEGKITGPLIRIRKMFPRIRGSRH